jgi:hypothetical protein
MGTPNPQISDERTDTLVHYVYQSVYALKMIYNIGRATLQRQKQIFPEKEYHYISPNFHIHASVRDLYSHDQSAYSAGGGNMYV